MPRPSFARCPYWLVLLVLLFAFLARGSMASSSASERWVRTYSGPDGYSEEGVDVAADAVGNAYVVGWISTDAGQDAVLLKYDAAGNLLWQRIFNGAANRHERASKVRVDPSGNVLMAGYTDGGATNLDFFLRKYDPQGTLLWSRIYGGTGNSIDFPLAMELDAAGDVYLAGDAGNDIVTLHYGSDGTLVWSRVYNGPDNKRDEAVDLELDAAGNVFVAGSVEEGPLVFGSPDWDFLVLKYSPAGNLIVDRIYDTEAKGSNKLAALTIDAQGNVCVAGQTYGPYGKNNIETIKYNNHLEPLWYFFYDDNFMGEDFPREILTDSQGNVYVLSQSELIGKWMDWLVVKYSPTGAKLWESSYGVDFNYGDSPAAMVIDPYDGIYVTGYVGAGNGSYSELHTRKLNPDGGVWAVSYPGSSSGRGLTVDAAGNVLVTGSAAVAGQGQDIVLLKYSQTAEAAPDAYSLNEDQPLTVTAPGVLGNDRGADLTAEVGTQPTHGTLVLGSAGSFTYTPDADYVGADSFTYRAFDGAAYSDYATVSLTVVPVDDPPVAQNDEYAAVEDTLLTVPVASGVLVNDLDEEGDPLTAAITMAPAHGLLGLNANGSFTYQPEANFAGVDSFTYHAQSHGLDSNTASVILTVAGVNDPPSAAGQSVTTAEDTSRSITLQGSDPDGDSLTYQVLNGPAHGALTGSGAARTYTPAANYSGADSFSYQVSDGTAVSGVATVSITVTAVNDTPVAQGQSVTATEDTPLPITLSATDVEGSPLAYTVATQPQHGLLSGTPPALTYTPALNYSGPDSFTFRAGDGVATSAPATVSITVTPVNDPPSATADSYAGSEDLPLTVAAPGVLANDSDPEGGLQAELEATTQHGTLQFRANGSFDYTPALNFHGADQFRYRPSDGIAFGASTTVTLTIAPVADPPVASGQSLTTLEDTPLPVTLSGSDPDGDSLSFLVGQPAHGTLSGIAPDLTYTPAADYAGPDSFTFRVSDGTAQSAPTVVTLTVTPVDDAPTGGDDAYSGSEDIALQIAAPGVLANDLDAEGAALQAVLLSDPAHGTVSLSANGAFIYTPAPNFHGTDGFQYLVFGGGKASNPVTVLLVVNSVNDPPAAATQSLTTGEDTPVGGTLSGSDVDGDALTYRIAAAPAHGTLTGTLPTFTYTPAANYHGADQFTFAVSDGAVESSAVVQLTVNPINDAPTATAEAYSTGHAARLTVVAPGVLGNDADPDGDPLHAVLLTPPTGGELTLNPDGSFIYQPWAGFSGEDGFSYCAADAQSVSDTVRVTLTVGEVPVSSASGKLSGSGKVALPGGQVGTLKVSASLDRRGRLKGQLTLKNLTTRQQVKSTQLLALAATGTRARLYGLALVNGATVSFALDVYDAPKPARDQAALLVGNGGGFALTELTSGKLTVKP